MTTFREFVAATKLMRLQQRLFFKVGCNNRPARAAAQCAAKLAESAVDHFLAAGGTHGATYTEFLDATALMRRWQIAWETEGERGTDLTLARGAEKEVDRLIAAIDERPALFDVCGEQTNLFLPADALDASEGLSYAV